MLIWLKVFIQLLQQHYNVRTLTFWPYFQLDQHSSQWITPKGTIFSNHNIFPIQTRFNVQQSWTLRLTIVHIFLSLFLSLSPFILFVVLSTFQVNQKRKRLIGTSPPLFSLINPISSLKKVKLVDKITNLILTKTKLHRFSVLFGFISLL